MRDDSVRTASVRARGPMVVMAFALLALGGFVIAGNLTPPPGPVAPTMKTLFEVEPRLPLNQTTAPADSGNQFRISQPGSYYLTGNITGVAGKTCIYIASENVTLDLNGFTLQGVTGSLIGIRINSRSATVRNGNVEFFSVGVDSYEAAGARLESLTSSSNVNDAFKVGIGNVADRCVAINSNPGFDAFESATFIACTARDSDTYAFEIGDSCTLTGCIARNSNVGFYVKGPSVLQQCSSYGNVAQGYRIEESSVLTDCVAFENSGAGFYGTARTRFTRCNARDNQYGFYLLEANSLVECTASSNDSNGVNINGNANTVERCTIHENIQTGLFISDGAGNNIDGNVITYNGFNGLAIATADNIAIRNRARGNTQANYSFAAGNDYGFILTNPGSGFTSSAAWANFAY